MAMPKQKIVNGVDKSCVLVCVLVTFLLCIKSYRISTPFCFTNLRQTRVMVSGPLITLVSENADISATQPSLFRKALFPITLAF